MQRFAENLRADSMCTHSIGDGNNAQRQEAWRGAKGAGRANMVASPRTDLKGRGRIKGARSMTVDLPVGALLTILGAANSEEDVHSGKTP